MTPISSSARAIVRFALAGSTFLREKSRMPFGNIADERSANGEQIRNSGKHELDRNLPTHGGELSPQQKVFEVLVKFQEK